MREKKVMNVKTLTAGFKFGAPIHAAAFLAAANWLLSREAFVRIIDQLDETMEFIFSPNPIRNYLMVIDVAAEAAAAKLIILVVATALPSYAIGYYLFPRSLRKEL